jgi:hypothetical protein
LTSISTGLRSTSPCLRSRSTVGCYSGWRYVNIINFLCNNNSKSNC